MRKPIPSINRARDGGSPRPAVAGYATNSTKSLSTRGEMPLVKLSRRSFAIGAALAVAPLRRAAAGPAEIKLGQTMAYSGPASAFGAVGRGEVAFFDMVNDQGGINGRKVNLISLDDGYNPAKTAEVARRLVEQEQVLAMFAALGTAPNAAIAKYLLSKRVPNLFIASGASKWGDPSLYPLSLAGSPDFRLEGQIYARYILDNKPQAKVAILWQNDDLGRDYIDGMKDGLGARFKEMVVASASYEVTDPTLDSQAISMMESGADVLVSAVTPKFGALIIRKIYDLAWKPMHFLSKTAISVSAVMKPAGVERGIGVMTATYFKDPGDPTWKDDPGVGEYRAFMAKYRPNEDASDASFLVGFGIAYMMRQVLVQCGDDISRENLMRQACALHDLLVPVWVPGIKVNTAPDHHRPITQMQLQRWNGAAWELFGSVISAAQA